MSQLDIYLLELNLLDNSRPLNMLLENWTQLNNKIQLGKLLVLDRLIYSSTQLGNHSLRLLEFQLKDHLQVFQ
jgi:hypothetical protein